MNCEETFSDSWSEASDERMSDILVSAKGCERTAFGTLDCPQLKVVIETTPHHRSLVISDMSRICSNYFLKHRTFQLARSYVDGFPTSPRDAREMWRRAVSCILLASKLEEVRPPTVVDLEKHSQGLFTAKELREQECLTLTTLQRHLYSQDTPCDWLRAKLTPASPFRRPEAFVATMGLVDAAALDSENLSRFGYQRLTLAAAWTVCPENNHLEVCDEDALAFMSELDAALGWRASPAVVPARVAAYLEIRIDDVYLIHVDVLRTPPL